MPPEAITNPTNDVKTHDLPTYTIGELQAKHNHPKTAYTAIHGRVYDISSFASVHPGGSSLILLASGRDATVLYETYHPVPPSPKILSKLLVGTLVDSPPSAYAFSDDPSSFYNTLKSRVVSRLKERGLARRGGSGVIYLKAMAIITAFWGGLLYGSLVAAKGWGAVLSFLVMGYSASLIGTCIQVRTLPICCKIVSTLSHSNHFFSQHDGSHGAFSSSPRLNLLAGWTMDMIGASAFTWEIQHMLGHHPFTNNLEEDQGGESDPDVFSSYPFLRFHSDQAHTPMNTYQHHYFPFLFASMTLAKVFLQDIQVFWEGKLYHIDAGCRYSDPKNVTRFVVMKIVSMAYMLFLPIYGHGLLFGSFLFVLGHLFCGELLAVMFIVNHVIEGAEFTGGKKNNGDNDWATIQCRTSVNWSPGSNLANHASGGLNHQVEHHLFPSICHTNYPVICDIVKATCAEFGVEYKSVGSFASAVGLMRGHLKKMGTNQQ